jgi:hypothetical protein
MNATFLAKQEQVLESHALLLVTPLRRDGHIVDVVAAAGGLHSPSCSGWVPRLEVQIQRRLGSVVSVQSVHARNQAEGVRLALVLAVTHGVNTSRYDALVMSRLDLMLLKPLDCDLASRVNFASQCDSDAVAIKTGSWKDCANDVLITVPQHELPVVLSHVGAFGSGTAIGCSRRLYDRHAELCFDYYGLSNGWRTNAFGGHGCLRRFEGHLTTRPGFCWSRPTQPIMYNTNANFVLQRSTRADGSPGYWPG